MKPFQETIEPFHITITFKYSDSALTKNTCTQTVLEIRLLSKIIYTYKRSLSKLKNTTQQFIVLLLWFFKQ